MYPRLKNETAPGLASAAQRAERRSLHRKAGWTAGQGAGPGGVRGRQLVDFSLSVSLPPSLSIINKNVFFFKKERNEKAPAKLLKNLTGTNYERFQFVLANPGF